MSDWIKWHGGERPVLASVRVEYITVDGRPGNGVAGALWWHRHCSFSPIAYYRIIKESPSMTTLDISKIAVGDEVTVRMVVCEPCELTTSLWYDTEVNVIGVRCIDDPASVQTRYPRFKHIVSHTPALPKPLEVGDRVRHPSNCDRQPVMLIAIHRQPMARAWIEHANGAMETVDLDTLIRA